MIELGKLNKLKVSRLAEPGAFLRIENQEVLLPKKYIPEECKEGDELTVFVYFDSTDRIIATTQTPLAQVGEFSFLQIKDVNPVGAFADWGLDKDLLIPYREQAHELKPNQWVTVYVYVDETSGRIVGSTKLNKFLSLPEQDLLEGDKVSLLIAQETEKGYTAIINNQYKGLLYKNELFSPIQPGDKVWGFVKKIREDQKIDLSLQKQGGMLVDDVRLRVLQQLKKYNNFLPLSDDSSPEEIANLLSCSKKAFKKAIGSLYKQHLINITPEGIHLLKEQ